MDAALGFRTESDRDSCRIPEVPAPLGRVAAVESIHDVLDALLANEEPEDPHEELLKELACQPVFTVGTPLSEVCEVVVRVYRANAEIGAVVFERRVVVESTPFHLRGEFPVALFHPAGVDVALFCVTGSDSLAVWMIPYRPDELVVFCVLAAEMVVTENSRWKTPHPCHRRSYDIQP